MFAEQAAGEHGIHRRPRRAWGVGTPIGGSREKEELLDAIAQLFVSGRRNSPGRCEGTDRPDPGTLYRNFSDFVVDFNAEKYRYAAASGSTTAADVTARTGDKVRELTSKAIDAGVLRT